MFNQICSETPFAIGDRLEAFIGIIESQCDEGGGDRLLVHCFCVSSLPIQSQAGSQVAGFNNDGFTPRELEVFDTLTSACSSSHEINSGS